MTHFVTKNKFFPKDRRIILNKSFFFSLNDYFDDIGNKNGGKRVIGHSSLYGHLNLSLKDSQWLLYRRHLQIESYLASLGILSLLTGQTSLAHHWSFLQVQDALFQLHKLVQQVMQVLI